MRRGSFCLTIISLVLVWGLFSSFDYVKEWESTDELIYTEPKLALNRIRAIEKHAKAERNAPQELCCIIKRANARSFIGDSSFVTCLSEVKKFRQRTKDDVARSVATFMVGELYRAYYQRKSYTFSNRTELGDYVPEDIKEWTPRLFLNTIHDNWFAAISNEKVKSTPSSQYEAIMSLGEDSRIYYPTLYDFFLSNMLEREEPSHYRVKDSIFSAKEKEKLMADWVDFHANDKERDAYVKTKLLSLERQFKDKKERSALIHQLESLLEEVKDQRASILVRIALLEELGDVVSLTDLPADSKLPQRMMDICEEGIKDFPDHKKIAVLHHFSEVLNKPRMSISLVNTKIHTSDTVKVKVSYANMNQLKLNLSRINYSSALDYECIVGFDYRSYPYDYYPFDYYDENSKDIPTTLLQSFLFDLPKSNYCILRDTVLNLSPLDYGLYGLRVDTTDKHIRFEVSDLICLTTGKGKRTSLLGRESISKDYVVMDANTGAPKPNVKLIAQKELISHKYGDNGEVYKTIGETSTDPSGFANLIFPPENESEVRTCFMDGGDVFLTPDYSGRWLHFSGYRWSHSEDDYAVVYTDRTIYRPSQTVYFKVVLYNLSKNKPELVANEKITVSLKNYGKEIEEKELVTNEFGSAASSFVIPANARTGTYVIDVESFTQVEKPFIEVAEYKRPTFEVKLACPIENFTFDDTIQVRGHADYLMGAPLSGAKVEYRVECLSWRCKGYGWRKEDVVRDLCKVSDDGSFVIPFVAHKRKDDRCDGPFYIYNVYAKVTDANGETHEEKRYVRVSDRPFYFTTSSFNLKTDTVFVRMENFQGARYKVVNLYENGQETMVSYEVSHGEEIVASGSVKSDGDGMFQLPLNTKKWASGEYKLTLKATDQKGVESASSYKLALFRKNDRRPPLWTALWSENTKDVELPVGEMYKVRVGSSLKNAYLLMVVTDVHDVVEKRWIQLNDEIKDFSFQLNEQNGGNLNVKFFLVNKGKLYSREFTITKKEESKEMPMILSVFRDKMQPGSKETWTLTLPKGEQAEVLASMYDASLDKFERYSHNGWAFDLEPKCRFIFPKWEVCRWMEMHIPLDDYYFTTQMDWSLDRFITLPDGAKHSPYEFVVSADYGKSKNMDMTGATSYISSSHSLHDENSIMAQYGMQLKNPTALSSQSDMAMGNVSQVRKNFAETAFFYPQLRTDKKGNVQFSFEMPESLTRWNFKALAHTKDLFFGQMSEQMVTQKDFMISPNLPRFLRKGDRCVLSAKVINLSESTIKGTALMELLDPVTEKVVAKQNAGFDALAGKNTVVTCSFDVPRDMDAVLVRTSAVAGDFSDAEQTLLPILSDRMVLTQSLPIYVRGGQTKEYTFENLVNNNSNTLSSRFLKLEFAKDPIWYAVQALPSVAMVEHENAVSYSAAHFASLMSEHIAKSNPKIFNVINMWKSQGMDKQTLLSNLEKNQDVKNILLNESPWVMEAKDETEMKQRLSTLFDVNELQNKCTLWFDKLMDFRLESGAYSWFKSIYPSTHTTLFVLDNFGRLRKAGIVDDAFLQRAQYRSSLQFLDGELRDAYEELKRLHPKDYKEVAYVGMNELYYFQVHSLFPEVKVDAKAKEAFTFYYELAKKRWEDFSLYGRALAAIAFYRGGDKELAKTIVESIREFSTTTDEMGMFWLKNESGYLWHQAPISAHTRLMEALEVVDPKVQEQDEMRLWLLNQKRTQNWDNTIANVDALNVLLLSGSDWLSNDNQVTIKLGGETVQPEKTEAGTGYFTHYINGDDVKPSMGHVELKSEAGGNISWGALYWQFEEEIDKVLKNKTALHVEKMVMLETRENGKPILKTIEEGTKLSVGDKLVVRVTLRTDRDMDYVSLKDQRASCLEPTQQLSGYRCSEGTCYYQSPKDAAMYYFFDHLAKGTYVFEYPLWVTHAGDYCNGITTAQCMYAPEFMSNTGSVRIHVRPK